MAEEDYGGNQVSLSSLNIFYDEKSKKEAFMAKMFLLHADKIRFAAKICKFQEDIEEGNGNYPTTVRGSYDLLLKVQNFWIDDRKRSSGHFFPGFFFY